MVSSRGYARSITDNDTVNMTFSDLFNSTLGDMISGDESPGDIVFGDECVSDIVLGNLCPRDIIHEDECPGYIIVEDECVGDMGMGIVNSLHLLGA